MVEYPDGKRRLVLAGGRSLLAEYQSHTFVLDLDTMLWKQVGDLPAKKAMAKSVPFGKTFLMLGGLFNGRTKTDILEFDPITEAWITRQEKLQYSRMYFTAFFVPEMTVECIK